MIDLHRLAKILKELKPDEVSVLKTLESLAHRFEYVPIEELEKKIHLEADDVLFLLGQLNKVRLVKRQKEHYLGYSMTQAGYDALALHELAIKDVIVSLGQPYGVGKESTVYRALDSEETEVAVKFLRWGRSSFKKVRRLRRLKDDTISSWMNASKQAAEREFKALRIIHRLGGQVPEPLAISRHVIVMSQMTGDLLLDMIELERPEVILDQILSQVQLAYHKAELVHGDLSEYNIFVEENEQIIIFDWPQWQPITHPNALWLLKRDITNILTFFKRRFRITYDVGETLEKLTTGTDRKNKNE
ncbi:MAG: RIO1 family regulatory kinase/ATPase [Promethearchaeota archaeon]